MAKSVKVTCFSEPYSIFKLALSPAWKLSKALLGTTKKHVVTAADVQSIIMQKKGSNCWDRPAPHQATKVLDNLAGNRNQHCYVVSDDSGVNWQLVCKLSVNTGALHACQ